MKLEGFKSRKVFIGGIQGSGKTQAARWLADRAFKKCIAVRYTPDFDDLPNVDLIDAVGDGQAQVEQVAEFLIREGRAYMNHGKKPTYDCWLLDEADMVFKSGMLTVSAVNDLVLMHRHYGLSLVFITRRPQDIPAKIIETSHFQFYFAVEGKNVKAHLAAVDDRITALLEQLRYKDYRFILKRVGEAPTIHAPLDIANVPRKRAKA
jgi:hypothetical protein